MELLFNFARRVLGVFYVIPFCFFLSTSTSAASVSDEQASDLQRCLNDNTGNALVPKIEGSEGWGDVPEGWISHDQYDAAIVDIYYYSNPDHSHDWYQSETEVRASIESKHDYPIDWFDGEAPTIRTGKDLIRGWVQHPVSGYRIGYNYGNCVSLSGCPEEYSNAKAHPSDNACKLANISGILIGHQKDPDCSDAQKQGYQVEQLLKSCGLVAEIPSKTDGNPLCSAGNPVDIASGNKYQSESIFAFPLPLSLSYNSSKGAWRHTYSQHLDISDTWILLIRPDGKGLTFTQNGGQWQSDGDVFYTLSAVSNSTNTAWEVVTPSGITEHYDSEGRIFNLTTFLGKTTYFTYTDQSVTVTDHLGNQMALVQDSEGQLQSATLNNEATATFEYDSEQRLIARTAPDGGRTHYHYENADYPNHLTGITGSDGRYRSF